MGNTSNRREYRLRSKAAILAVAIAILIISSLTNGLFLRIPLIKIAEAVDITTWSDTNTTINVSVQQPESQINWFDLWDSDNNSMLDQDIDVNEEYRFCFNITDYHGWEYVKYINITAWYDNGSEANTYNTTQGGNLNLFLQYDNTSGTAEYNMFWPDDEVTKGAMVDTPIDGDTHNLSFAFTPGYQFRYSPSSTGTGSWNVNVTINNDGGYNSYTDDEFGVYMYTMITQCTENPSGAGTPGENNVELSPHTNVTTRCNANYSLYTSIPNLTKDGGGAWIENTNLSAEGGALSRTNFDGVNPLYLYGGAATYRNHLVNTTEDTVEVAYWVNITLGQLPGNYSATVTYTINGEV